MYYEHNDKADKILATQLRGLRAKQLIPGIHTATGEITSKQKCISDKFKEVVYSNLYTSDCSPNSNGMNKFFNTLEILFPPSDL